MPFGMGDCVQSVVIQKRLYVGGGFAGWGSENNYVVMECDIGSGEWTTLPQYRASYFAMAAVSDQLVLVGGEEHGGESKVLGVWGVDRMAWTHPYPELPTARSRCSAVVYNEWLVTAGGYASGNRASCVEVLNTGNKQWYAGPPTPTAWDSMKTAVVGNTAYLFLGGWENAVDKVYHVYIPTLLSHITSKASSGTDREIWKEILGLQLKSSTPLSISGYLLAVGGRDKDGRVVTAINLYQPDRRAWMKVGDLPTPHQDCTCAMITDKEVLVAGGRDGRQCLLKKVDLALIA